MKPFKPILLVLLAGLILAACGAPGNILPPTGTETPAIPTEAPFVTPSPQVSPQPSGEVEPGEVLVQLDYEPTFSLIQHSYEFGRVPPFTLYADGTLIYVDEGSSFDQQQVMQVQLSAEEAQALLAQVLGYGFERLETHTDFCEQNADGTQNCIADASFTIFRARMPDGELREVKIYANFTEDKQAFDDINNFLTAYTHPEAQPYVPEQATLFVEPFSGEPVENALAWSLSPSYLEPSGTDLNLRAWTLEGEDLQAFLAAASRNSGNFTFEHEGQFYSVYLTPWLPGADFTEEIEAEFPAADPAGTESPSPTP